MRLQAREPQVAQDAASQSGLDPVLLKRMPPILATAIPLDDILRMAGKANRQPRRAPGARRVASIKRRVASIKKGVRT